MSQQQANCPNCGAAVRFLWSGAVQTTCGYCHSILVRRDLDLEKVGIVADLPRDVSPIQIATGSLSQQGISGGGPHSLRIRRGRLERMARRISGRNHWVAVGRATGIYTLRPER